MGWPRPTRRDLADAALAVALAGVSVAETAAGNREPGPLGPAVLTDLLLTLPLALRRRAALAVLAWSLVLLTIQAALHVPGGIGVFFGALVPVYTVAANRPGRAALVALLLPSLRAIQHAGRAALADLRRSVGVLRAPGDVADLRPAPGLADAGALVDRMRAAGLQVSLVVWGEPRDLPGGVELAAYRVLHEALTNTLRHAGPTRASAVVGYGPRELVVEVCDEGPPAPRPAPAAGGHGLTGTRERLALYGGELTAGPAGTGYRVRAHIPAGGPA